MSSYSASTAARKGSIVPPLSGVDSPLPSDTPEQCDVLICGTGLVESVLAAALAWQGSNVLHIDAGDAYGDANAVLTVDQLQNWVAAVNSGQVAGFSSALLYMPRPLTNNRSRHLIDLTPKILFAQSDLLDLLRQSRVHKYIEFRPLGSFHTYENDSFDKVAGSKEDIFSDQSLSLLTKRRLMKFLKFVLVFDRDPQVWEPHRHDRLVDFLKSAFQLDQAQIVELVTSIGLCTTLDVTVVEGLSRIRRYMTSLDVLGTFPAIYSSYGGAGELAQGFCRSAAVAGATYRLQTRLVSFDSDSSMATFGDGSRVHVAEKVVVSPSSAVGLAVTGTVQQQQQPPSEPKEPGKPSRVHRLVAIVNKTCKQWFAENESAAVVVFPPQALKANVYAVQAIVMGSESCQCPAGQAIWYLSTVEPDPTLAREQLEEALAKLEASILRESTEDFEFDGLDQADVAIRNDGLPVISSVKLGKSMQSFVPKEKLQYMLKLGYSQQFNTVPGGDHGAILHSNMPDPEISYDGVVGAAKALYSQIVGSDDDFFVVDFEDDDEDRPVAEPQRPQSGVYTGQLVGSDDIDMEL